jgi:hypothetical protein
MLNIECSLVLHITGSTPGDRGKILHCSAGGFPLGFILPIHFRSLMLRAFQMGFINPYPHQPNGKVKI